jgi:excinuclease ABC subunit A
MHDQITIKNARLHNLKNISLEIPKNKLVAFTGLSGSGKSTLVFDTLHKEGQRQYMESLGLVTDQLVKPAVDSIIGLSPSISVDQHLTNHSPRSTVGTVTEVYTYLRVLFARLGHRPCPGCGADVPPSHDLFEESGWEDETPESDKTIPCPACGLNLPEMGMANFSFNKPDGACPTCTGLGTVHEPILSQLVDENRSINAGAITGWEEFHLNHYGANILPAAAKYFGFDFDADRPIREYAPAVRDYLLYGMDSPQFKRHYPEKPSPKTNANGRFEGVVTNLLRRYNEHANDPAYREKMGYLFHQRTCPECDGTRLRPESRSTRVDDQSIVDVLHMPLTDLMVWLDFLPMVISVSEMRIAEPILNDLKERVCRLIDVGVGYLTLERSSPTLSAGEAQRLRLASLLGSGLTGVLYVLDEPTIGLHPRDTGRLINVMRQLRDLGNTVLVIEHDLDVLRASDFVVDIGPGAGQNGGTVIVAGTPETVKTTHESLTGGYLSGRLSFPTPVGRPVNGRELVIHGARAHNLRNVTARIPLGLLVTVTGPSGSGKSSLMFDILDRAARQRFNGASDEPGEHDKISGWEHLDRIITIDQAAIGRTPRSNAATYTDAFTPIREAFAALPEARRAKLTSRHFSFNVPGGRCERCQGAGVLTVEMHFLPDVEVRCPACRGRRFKREILDVKYRGYDIAQVLNLTIEEALPLFQDVTKAASRLDVMVDVGLGYLQLGQPATTLSGGEAQRVKLAKELGRRTTGHTLYLLDEPTTGLHPDDSARLLGVLQRLVDAGHSVVVIEHNLDVIRAADWVIDLGPEGGAAGGEIVAEGTPEQVARNMASVTGAFLSEEINMAYQAS